MRIKGTVHSGCDIRKRKPMPKAARFINIDVTAAPRMLWGRYGYLWYIEGVDVL